MRKILVIDDDVGIRDVLARVLKTREYDVSFAEDGLEGLEKAEEIGPDLILLDVQMPRMNGLSLCHLLKKGHKTAKIPVLFVTSDGTLGTVEDALKEGANGYIVKPIDFVRLTEKIEALFKTTREDEAGCEKQSQ
jgi:DNA-binding response OmpR family regulator